MPRAEAKYTLRAEDKTARGLRSAETRLGRFRQNTSRILASGLTRLAAPVAAVGAAFTAWAGTIAGVSREVQTLNERATALGVTVQEIAEIDLAASLAGSSGEDFADALRRIDDLLNEVKRGTKDAVEFFDELGVNATALASIDDATDRVAALSDQFVRLQQTDPRRAQALIDQFGGGRAGRLLLGGGERIRQGAAEARRLGLTDLDPEDALAVVESLTKFNAVVSKRWQDAKLALGGSQVLANAIDIATNALAGTSERPPEQGGTFIPGLQLPVGGTNAPRETTQQAQLTAQRDMVRYLSRIADGARRGQGYQ